MDKIKENFKKVACEAALKSGLFIKRHLGRAKKISYKGEINLVTDIDKKAEKVITDLIRKAFPGHSILAEEGSCSQTGSDYKWVIDPLDGTTNYAHRFPVFSVSIALEFKGAPVLGVVYDPTREELFAAEKGKRAFLNKKRIKVSEIKNISKALVATGFAYNLRAGRDNNIDNFTRFLKRAQAVRRAGSASLDLCYVACGRLDGFWELDLNPWDTAAGVLIVKEAGGRITRFDGAFYSHYGKDIVASNGKIHTQMTEVLAKG